MIRNAGGLATDDVVRSLILSTHLLGTRSIAIIQHTECGLLSITDEQMRFSVELEMARCLPSEFSCVHKPGQHLANQVKRVRENPFLSKSIQVRGYIYDVKKGSLREVQVD